MVQIKINSNIIFCACEKFLIKYNKELHKRKNNEYMSTKECAINSEIFIREKNKILKSINAMRNMSQYANTTNFQYLILTDKEFHLIMRYL